jgi:small-conductance mechanosensitive channel
MIREILSLMNNSPRELLDAIVAVAALLALVYLLKTLLRLRLRRARGTATRIDDLLLELASRTMLRFWFFPALSVGVASLAVPPRFAAGISVLAKLSFLLQIGFWVTTTVEHWMAEQRRKKLETDAAAATSIAALTFIVKVGIWSVIILAALENFGFDITTILAGLGVGGVAIALATQKILGDLFASLSIVLDKPFVIGDLITVGTEIGTVEYVGLKTTRIRSVTGEELIISNSDLLASRIRNFKRMTERRVMLPFGVIYQTPHEKLERIPAILKEIVESVEMTRFDRAHFKAFGASSLDFEAVYWVLSPGMVDFMDRQQMVNLELVRRFEQEGIEFAYPTQTIFVARENGDA